jgi:hypothetical protein
MQSPGHIAMYSLESCFVVRFTSFGESTSDDHTLAPDLKKITGRQMKRPAGASWILSSQDDSETCCAAKQRCRRHSCHEPAAMSLGTILLIVQVLILLVVVVLLLMGRL